MRHLINRIRRRRAQRRDVELLHPDEAAGLCRMLSRSGVADRHTLILLAQRGQESELPGNRPAMQKYERAFRAGRRVRYAVFPVRFLEPVPRELAEAVESVFEGDER